jgi:predicted DsbA family dithiol-disulfide isomerase
VQPSARTTAGPGPADLGYGVEARQEIQVDIISDVICPWCFIGKRRLAKAAAGLPADIRLSVRWLPFELNPHMPAEGMDRVAYRTAKFGSWERAQARDAEVAAIGAQEGIGFRHERMIRTPNSFDAHRLIWLADQAGVQDAMVEALFSAYFVEGRDIGDAAVLAELAVGVGLALPMVESLLAGGEGAAEVREAEANARRQGVSGVPSFIIDGRPAFSGAQQSELMLRYLLHVGQAA